MFFDVLVLDVLGCFELDELELELLELEHDGLGEDEVAGDSRSHAPKNSSSVPSLSSFFLAEVVFALSIRIIAVVVPVILADIFAWSMSAAITTPGGSIPDASAAIAGLLILAVVTLIIIAAVAALSILAVVVTLVILAVEAAMILHAVNADVFLSSEI